MLAWIALLFLCLVGAYQFFNYIKYVNKISSLFEGGKDVWLKDIILFPNMDLARYIKKSFDKENKNIKIYYLRHKYILLYSSYSKEQILDKLDEIQAIIIDDRVKNTLDLAVDDGIDREILEIWLDYGYNRRYRTIFKQQMNELLKLDAISDFECSIMYSRFYKFKRI